MILSPFTPIFFNRRKGIDGVESRYLQTFANTDQINVQVIASTSEEEPTASIYIAAPNPNDDEKLYDIVWNEWEMNDNDKLYFTTITGLSDGTYYMELNGEQSELFRVTSDESELAQTVLVQYANASNRQRVDAVFYFDGENIVSKSDVLFFVAGLPTFFDFRVHGGFKDNGWNFSVDNEQFVTDGGNIVQLYSQETTSKQLTIGEGEGVPVWLCEHLNRALCCEFVYIDGVRYARSGQATPELQQVQDNVMSFVANQQVQVVTLLDKNIEANNRLVLRRTDDDYRLTNIYSSTFRNINERYKL